MRTESRRLRTNDAAEYVGLSPRTLEKKRLEGTGPRYLKIGRAVIYDTSDLDDYLAAFTRTSTSGPGPEDRPSY